MNEVTSASLEFQITIAQDARNDQTDPEAKKSSRGNNIKSSIQRQLINIIRDIIENLRKQL